MWTQYIAHSAAIPAHTIQALRVGWNPVKDKLTFENRLNFPIKKRGIHSNPDLTSNMVPGAIPHSWTYHSVLEQVMRIYDFPGWLSPFLLNIKLLLHKTWELKLGWDNVLPEECRARWIIFFQDMFELQSVDYERCLKAQGVVEKPTLVLFPDANDKAYGALHKNISLLAVPINATYEHNSPKYHVIRTLTKLKGKWQIFDPGPQLTRTNVN